MNRHFHAPNDISATERATILRRAAEIRSARLPAAPTGTRVGGLYFNPSLRTRVSWEQAAQVVGATCQTLNASSDSWAMEFDPSAVMDGAEVENIVEAAGVLGRYFHILGVRSFPTGKSWESEREEPVLAAFKRYADTSTVSLEGALHHPCQGLADILTIHDHFPGAVKGLPVTLTWAWHPKALPMAVPNTFALQCALEGCDLTIANPKGFDLDPLVLGEVHQAAAESRGSVTVTNDQRASMESARVVYAKSWGALEGDAEARAANRGWILDEPAWNLTNSAKVMHCLPVRRNVVVAGGLLDSPASVVLDQAENRLWAQAALIEFLAAQRGVHAH